MQTFSQRMGITQPKTLIQVADMDNSLRNALWNGLVVYYWNQFKDEYYSYQRENIQGLWIKIWALYFEGRLDEKPESKEWLMKEIKRKYFGSDWYEVYEFIEFILNHYEPPYGENDDVNSSFISYCNLVLERELSGYRILDQQFAPLTSEEELESVQNALKVTDTFAPVRQHLSRAVQHLSDKKAPDYRNSIKESISAVESLCSLITNEPKSTLGQALKKIEKEHELHPALKNAFSNLYGYTSDAKGIRHALLDVDQVKQEDAIYMLVSCSAFVNYLLKKSVSGADGGE